jgi:hypothetical protein
MPQSFLKQPVGLGSVLFGAAILLTLAIVTVTNEALVPVVLAWLGTISAAFIALGCGLLWMVQRRINRRKKSN